MRRRACRVLLVFASVVPPPWPAHAADPSPPGPAEPPAASADVDDTARKAAILAGERWRRAMFEFGAWLEAQTLYDPERVRRIRADLDHRVAGMSSWEVEYLLEGLDAKLRVLESPRAREAREWVGRYLAVLTDRRRAELLADVPNVLDLTAAELAARLDDLEARRAAIEAHAMRSQRTQRETEALVQRGRAADATLREDLARIRRGTAAFSPYRPQPVADPPFADTVAGPPGLIVGPWGVAFGIDVGAL